MHGQKSEDWFDKPVIGRDGHVAFSLRLCDVSNLAAETRSWSIYVYIGENKRAHRYRFGFVSSGAIGASTSGRARPCVCYRGCSNRDTGIPAASINMTACFSASDDDEANMKGA